MTATLPRWCGLLAGLPFALFCPGEAAAQRQAFAHPDGTTHWFEAVAVPGGIDWEGAHRAAAAAGGHLATITSQAENDAVFQTVSNLSFWSGNRGPWVGGRQAAGSPEPRGGWGWVEPEPFGYDAWAAGEPDDANGADRIHFFSTTGVMAPSWADANAATKQPGYVIEFAGPRAPRTLGLQVHQPASFDGYTLINPLRTTEMVLIDPRGRVVHSWSGALPQAVAYLEPNGHLLRGVLSGNTKFTRGGSQGLVEEYDWQGNKVWSFQYSSSTFCSHHDFTRLPNGNLLLIAWEWIDKATALAAGRDPALLADDELWPDKIIEVQPTASGGNIVWEWRAWDHLIQDLDATKGNYGDVAKHPERIDLNYDTQNGIADWLHSNAIHYNPRLDQIILSVREFHEVWVIDHSTTTAEAASSRGGRSGKGGDLLYRWGNPAAYRAGTKADQRLFRQHDAQWIDDNLPGGGRLLVFNNGPDRGYSSVEEVAAPTPDARGNYPRSGAAWGPKDATWTYTAPNRTDFFSGFISGAQRLPNGNTLICEGQSGRSFEVTPAKQVVWQYMCPFGPAGTLQQGDQPLDNRCFRTYRYPKDYPAFRNRILPPGAPKEVHGSVLLADGSTLAGRARVGSTVALTLRSAAAAASGSRPAYQLATSSSAGLIAIDTRFAGLAESPLVFASISGAHTGTFANFRGRLDANGEAAAGIVIPPLSALAGLELHTAFVMTDPTAPSTVGLVSNTVAVRVVH